ncbi:MAG: phospholipase D-like domain-containing protein [Ginsengibacter sp.]
MPKVTVRPFLSPTLVLLAMNWEEGKNQNDFLGFAIKRTPGFRPKQGAAPHTSDWLPNRLGFKGPNPGGTDAPSNKNPIQHFQWWDARINTEDRGKVFSYEVYPVKGKPGSFQLLDDKKSTIKCTIPLIEEEGIGTYFNRAVVSSQSFAKEFGHITTPAQYSRALIWLSNGMNEGLQNFISQSKGFEIAGAAYHLTDTQWVIPELKKFSDPASFVYFYKAPSASGKDKGDNANQPTIDGLKNKKNIKFYRRTKSNIMHDKFIVRTKGDQKNQAAAVLSGTANFTTEGLTQQANVIHTFASPELAGYYLERQIFLRDDPPVSKTALHAEWSPKVKVGDATIRVFFAPEAPAGNPKKGTPGSRVSIDDVVHAVKTAKSSVLFSLFSATDKPLLDACTSVADSGKLMRGLVNSISANDPAEKEDGTENASTVAATWLYEKSKQDNMVVGHDRFGANKTPNGFWQESNVLNDPGKPKSPGGKGGNKIPNVFVHQKIVIVDGDTNSPTIFVGSANLSGNSTWHNDENLLEITKCPRLGKTYVAEFMRLYEQYRARFSWNRSQQRDTKKPNTFTLTSDASWAKKDFTIGTMEFIARKAFAGK